MRYQWHQVMATIVASQILATCGTQESPKTPDEPVNERVYLKPNRPDAKVVRLQQIERQQHSERFKIPVFPEITDEFFQAEESMMRLDILIIVDNSISMGEEQANLSTKMGPLLSAIEDVDWRIGIINTEWPCFKDRALPFDSSTANLSYKFASTINQGTDGSGYERGITMGGYNIMGIEYESTDMYATEYGEKCTPSPWLRDDTSLAVLILADEDEDEETSTWTPEDFVKVLKDKKYTPGESARVYGIIWRPGTECKDAYKEGFRYAELIAMTGGIMGDICAEDYSQALKAISANFRDLVLQEYELRAAPILRTLKISLNGALYQGQYSIVGNKLVLASPLDRNDRMVVTYKVQEARTLNLKHDADPRTVEILVNGEPMKQESFNYIRAERRLNFSQPLLEGAEIEIRYREDRPLRVEYPFPKLKEEQGVECYLNERQVAVDYFREEGLIRLQQPHMDGEEVICLYMPQNA
jgi:hypothetical protein